MSAGLVVLNVILAVLILARLLARFSPNPVAEALVSEVRQLRQEVREVDGKVDRTRERVAVAIGRPAASLQSWKAPGSDR
jgi:hypothetical protein